MAGMMRAAVVGLLEALVFLTGPCEALGGDMARRVCARLENLLVVVVFLRTGKLAQDLA